MLAQPSLCWILVNVTQCGEEIRFTVHRLTLETILEQMSNSLIFDVIPIYEPTAQTLKDLLKVLGAFLDQQVDVVSHKAICEQLKSAYCLTVF